MTGFRFTWDEDKNLSNQNKHGLSFEDACHVFFDPLHLSLQDRVEVIRIISARRATRRERTRYENT